MAQPFDAQRLEFSGEAVQVAAQVGPSSTTASSRLRTMVSWFTEALSGKITNSNGLTGRGDSSVWWRSLADTRAWLFHRTEGGSLFPGLILRTRRIGMSAR